MLTFDQKGLKKKIIFETTYLNATLDSRFRSHRCQTSTEACTTAFAHLFTQAILEAPGKQPRTQTTPTLTAAIT